MSMDENMINTIISDVLRDGRECKLSIEVQIREAIDRVLKCSADNDNLVFVPVYLPTAVKCLRHGLLEDGQTNIAPILKYSLSNRTEC